MKKKATDDFQVTDSRGKPMFFADGKPIMASHFDPCFDDKPVVFDPGWEREMSDYIDKKFEEAFGPKKK